MDFVVPDLKFDAREGGYARGQDGFEQILRAALSVLIESGHKALTMRRIAAECGMNAGSINYYFKSKDELIKALLDAIVRAYEDVIEAAMQEASGDPELKMSNLIQLILQDITTRKTTVLFPELWALSNHDTFVKDRLYDLYRREHLYFALVVRDVNKQITPEECDVVATFIMGSLEGMTVFAGHEKPWRSMMPQIEAAACACFVSFVRDLKPGVVGRLPVASLAL